MKRNEMNGQATKRQGQKMSGGWLLAVVCLLFASSCRAPAPEVGRYQWCVASGGENGGSDRIYVIDTVTGEIAVRHAYSSWSPFGIAQPSTPDWNAIRAEREEWIKQQEERAKQAKEASEKRDALIKAYAQMPLEKQVAWAKTISVGKVVIHDIPKLPGLLGRTPGFSRRALESLKREGGLCADECRQPYKAADEGLVVWFNGMADGGSIEFGLSPTPSDVGVVFPAPATIVDDVKAEIKRQEAMQKIGGVDAHGEAVK